MSKNIYFWGCQIPARLPFIEKSIRVMMDMLGQKVEDIDGFTCCPEATLVKNMGKKRWELTAARNIAVAENVSKNAVIITPCNGCSGTLKEVSNELKNSPQKRDEINGKLAKINLKIQATSRVKHLIEFLHDDVGISNIKDKVKKSLRGMRIAVHTGCHYASPSTSLKIDNPLSPKKFDAILGALDAEIVEYDLRSLCCGQDLANSGNIEESFEMLRQKVLSIQKVKADAIAVCCPACFIQLDQKQYMISRQGDKLNTPVFFISELIDLALGVDKNELGLTGHRTELNRFLGKWEDILTVSTELYDIDMKLVEQCYNCGACINDCPTCKVEQKFDPAQIMKDLLDGKLDKILVAGNFWLCMQCHTCYEMCVQRFGMEKVFAALRQIAIKRGIVPTGVKMGIDMFNKTGKLGEPAERQRSALGLKEFPKSGVEDLKKILDDEKK